VASHQIYWASRKLRDLGITERIRFSGLEGKQWRTLMAGALYPRGLVRAQFVRVPLARYTGALGGGKKQDFPVPGCVEQDEEVQHDGVCLEPGAHVPLFRRAFWLRYTVGFGGALALPGLVIVDDDFLEL